MFFCTALAGPWRHQVSTVLSTALKVATHERSVEPTRGEVSPASCSGDPGEHGSCYYTASLHAHCSGKHEKKCLMLTCVPAGVGDGRSPTLTFSSEREQLMRPMLATSIGLKSTAPSRSATPLLLKKRNPWLHPASRTLP